MIREFSIAYHLENSKGEKDKRERKTEKESEREEGREKLHVKVSCAKFYMKIHEKIITTDVLVVVHSFIQRKRNKWFQFLKLFLAGK